MFLVPCFSNSVVQIVVVAAAVVVVVAAVVVVVAVLVLVLVLVVVVVVVAISEIPLASFFFLSGCTNNVSKPSFRHFDCTWLMSRLR